MDHTLWPGYYQVFNDAASTHPSTNQPTICPVPSHPYRVLYSPHYLPFCTLLSRPRQSYFILPTLFSTLSIYISLPCLSSQPLHNTILSFSLPSAPLPSVPVYIYAVSLKLFFPSAPSLSVPLRCLLPVLSVCSCHPTPSSVPSISTLHLCPPLSPCLTTFCLRPTASLVTSAHSMTIQLIHFRLFHCSFHLSLCFTFDY